MRFGKSIFTIYIFSIDNLEVRVLPLTLSYRTYAGKYLHLCPTLLPKFNNTHVKDLHNSICIIAVVCAQYGVLIFQKGI
jgi:hypothetical protein